MIPTIAHMKKRLRQQTLWDIAVLKGFCLVAGALLGAWYGEWVLRNKYPLLVIAVVLFLVLGSRWFGGGSKEPD